jgi:hypothetical protein
MQYIHETKIMRVLVPAGTYFLGDPCYAVPDALWDALLQSCDYFQSRPIGEVNGHKVLGFNTKYGDGTYVDQDGNEFGVDAGLIGLVPEALIDKDEMCANYGTDFNKHPGLWVEFHKDVVCATDGARLEFGKYRINTDV